MIKIRKGNTAEENSKSYSVLNSSFLSAWQPLDFERKGQYSIRVQVENVHIDRRFLSMGPFRDEATIKVIVEDVDEPPVFERASYEMEVKEDALKNTVIGSVSAFDPDEKKSLVRYRILVFFNSKILKAQLKGDILWAKTKRYAKSLQEGIYLYVPLSFFL